MITKAIVQSINSTGTRCVVRMPLFETAANATPIEATALVNITPGVFNNIAVGDRVFVGFEENAIEKPIILGKLFRGANVEGHVRGGGGHFNTLKVQSSATIPSSTVFTFPASSQPAYEEFKTPKKMADYIKKLENNIISIEARTSFLGNYGNSMGLRIDDGDLDQ